MTAPSICPECGKDIVEKEGTSRKTGKPYHMFSCSGYPECKYVFHEPRGSDQRQEAIIEKKLNQVLFLLTGINVDSNPEEFKQILEERFGKRLWNNP